jgi:signal transduction histidine kinase
VPSIDDEIQIEAGHNGERLRGLRGLGVTSYMVVPMIARGHVVGAFSVLSGESRRRYGPYDLEVATHLARRAALAVDNARLYEESRAATRLREELLAVVSHDLKNPLGAINLAANLLARKLSATPFEAKVRKQVETIQRSCGRMDRLIGDLLDLASIQTGRLKVELGREEVVALVQEAVEEQAAGAIEKGVALLAHIDAARSLSVVADRSRLLQVFGNLIGNAVKFCRSGDSVIIAAEPRGNDLAFSVTDNGPGISEGDLLHIFEPYWSGARNAQRGTGLGLYISKGIVEAHGGRLWVDSQVGVGSTFFFTIPMVRG